MVLATCLRQTWGSADGPGHVKTSNPGWDFAKILHIPLTGSKGFRKELVSHKLHLTR